MEILWWHWIVLGIVLMLAELAVPAFFLIWFGAAAVVVGALTALVPAFTFVWQVIVWTVVSLLLVWFWFKVFKRNFHKTRVGLSKGSFVGEVALVTRDIAPYEKGQVRFQKPIVGDDRWDAIADEQIRTGERVRVLDVEGNILKVGKA